MTWPQVIIFGWKIILSYLHYCSSRIPIVYGVYFTVVIRHLINSIKQWTDHFSLFTTVVHCFTVNFYGTKQWLICGKRWYIDLIDPYNKFGYNHVRKMHSYYGEWKKINCVYSLIWFAERLIDRLTYINLQALLHLGLWHLEIKAQLLWVRHFILAHTMINSEQKYLSSW